MYSDTFHKKFEKNKQIAMANILMAGKHFLTAICCRRNSGIFSVMVTIHLRATYNSCSQN